MRGRRKLISIYIGAAISLFITGAHELFSLSSFTGLPSSSSDARQSGDMAQRTARSDDTDRDDSSDSEFAPFTESESEDSLSSEEDSSFSDMRFMRADCDKALCVDPCFKEYHTLKYY